MGTTDLANLIVSLLSLIVAVIVFVVTSTQAKRATEEQTKQENVRATLTDFGSLRREHQYFTQQYESQPEKRQLLIKAYLSDLERFAVGCNQGAYDLETVNRMSGGMLISQYNTYFKDYIELRRNTVKLTTLVKRSNLYVEAETMMQRLFELRDEHWNPPEMIPDDRWILERFLNLPISSEEPVFSLFRSLPGAVESHGEEKQGYIFVPGTRPDRCVLAAHADTVFDLAYKDRGDALSKSWPNNLEHQAIYENGLYHGTNPLCSIGADDRAGCAMLWALKDSGHSLLITDGEEHGQVGAHYLKDSNPSLFNELNQHTFILQLDRRGNHDYRYYDLPVTEDFIDYVERSTGYELATGKGRTDIVALCEKVCGANLSIGYYNEHKPDEQLNVSEWLQTLEIVRSMLVKPLKRYPLKQSAR